MLNRCVLGVAHLSSKFRSTQPTPLRIRFQFPNLHRRLNVSGWATHGHSILRNYWVLRLFSRGFRTVRKPHLPGLGVQNWTKKPRTKWLWLGNQGYSIVSFDILRVSLRNASKIVSVTASAREKDAFGNFCDFCHKGTLIFFVRKNLRYIFFLRGVRVCWLLIRIH